MSALPQKADIYRRPVSASLQKIEMILFIHFSTNAAIVIALIIRSTGDRMAKGYWIVRVSVHDHERYPEYLAAAEAAFKKYGAKFIVRGGAYDLILNTIV